MIDSTKGIQIFWLALILAIVSGCVTTTDVEAPDYAYPDSSFQAIVTIEVSEGGKATGQLGVLVPIGWEADNVTYTGPSSGSMFYDNTVSTELEYMFSSNPWDHWIGFQTSSPLSSDSGDCYQITLNVYTDGLVGVVDLAFLGMADYFYDDDPFPATIEVVELNLEQSTWGAVKSEFSL